MRLSFTRHFAALFVVTCSSILVAAEPVAHTKEPLSEINQNIADEKAVLVDVREKGEWDSGHIEGAIFLPLSRLRDGVTESELKPLPEEKVIYLHCRSGGRCLVAGKILEKQGYDIRPLKPGYDALISAGFPKAKP